MGIQQIEELNQKRLQKRKEVEIFLNNIINITKNKKFNFNIEEITFELTGLIDKFSRDSVKISLLSEISSGKSTFLNALVFNNPTLESKIGETTSKLFHIKYGEKYTIDGVEKENLDALKAQIALENSTNLKAIRQDKEMLSIQSVITLPNENLKKGIELYDTPGFAAIKEKRIITLLKEVISKSDVTILLLDISQGIKESEHLFIRNMFRNIQINKRFIVLNKYDTIVNEDDLILKSKEEIKEEIETLIDGLGNTLKKLQNDSSQKIESYYLSAKKALVAKVQNNASKLEESRFSIFEEAFWSRVVEAKDELLEDNIKIFNALKKRVYYLFQEKKIRLEKEKESIKAQINTSSKNQSKILSLQKDLSELKSLNSTQREQEQRIRVEISKLTEDILYILKINLVSKLTAITPFQKLQIWSLKKRYEKAILSILEDAHSYITQQMNNFIRVSSSDRKEMNALLWNINQNLKERLIRPDYDQKIDLESMVDRVIIEIKENTKWNSSTLFALLTYNILRQSKKRLEPSYFELKKEILGLQQANNYAILKRVQEREKCIFLVEEEIQKMQKELQKNEILNKEIIEIQKVITQINFWLKI